MTDTSDIINDDYESRLAKSLALHKGNEIEQAINHYQACIDHNPKRAEAYFFLGMLHAQHQEWHQAIVWLKKAHLRSPEHIQILNAVANAHKHLQEFDQALLYFNQACKLKPKDTQSLLNLASLYQVMDEDQKAETILNQLIQENPKYHDALYNLSLIKAKNNDFQGVIQRLEPIAPELQGASYLLLGQACIQTGAYQKASSFLHQALESHSSALDEIHFQLGLAYDQLQLSSKAHWHYEQCIAIDPEYFEAHSNLADSYVKTRHYQRALPHYSFLLQHHPDHAHYLYHMGLIYMQLDQHQNAIDYFNQTLKKEPGNLAAHLNLANTYLNLNAIDQAVTCYEALLKFHPDHKEAQFTLLALKQQSSPDKMPVDFIAKLFSQYAPHYDNHLSQTLQYQVPEKLVALLEQHLPQAYSSLNILDIGCGSGLMAQAIQNYAKTMDGIDLAESMLELCQQKQCYQHLWQGDFCELVLEQCYDLLIAADVFPYIGSLEPFFAKAKTCMRPNGLLLFSAEKSYDADFQLQQSIRYAHKPSYIKKSLDNFGFELIADENAILRKQRGADLHGHLFLARIIAAQT